MRYAIIILLVAALLLVGCGGKESPPTTTGDTTPATPTTTQADSGADETGADTSGAGGAPTGSDEAGYDNDDSDSDDSGSDDYPDELLIATKDFELTDVNGYLDAFVNRKTYIIFDQERAKGPVVGAAIELISYFNQPGYHESTPITADAKMDTYLDKNIILLGNGCNNALIAEVLDGEDCVAGLKPGEGMIRIGKVDSMRVLIILGYDDEVVYEIVKKLVAEEVEYTGPEKKITV